MDELRLKLREIANTHMSSDAAHDLGHLDRVWTSVKEIAAGEGAGDIRVLLGATYLHDIVNLPKDSPDRAKASTFAADMAAPILAGLNYTAAENKAAQHAIAAHSHSAGIPPLSPEARILRDADRLDALGAIGVARAFAVAGSLGQRFYDGQDPFAENRTLDDTRVSLDHWQVKLLGLRDGLLTETARKIARRRLDFMRAFLEQLATEIGLPVPQALLSRF